MVPTPTQSRTQVRKFFLIALVFFFSALFFYLLWWKLRLGLIRYFDPDEFQYLHLSYQIFLGRRPYFDFLLYITPLYLALLSKLFLFSGGTTALVVARLISFVVFVVFSLTVGALFWVTKKSWLAIVAICFLATLPLPADKFLEIRPDVFAATLFFLGIIFQVFWSGRGKNRLLFLSGLLYGLSLLTIQKALPGVLFAAFVIFLESRAKPKRAHSLASFLGGILLPWAVFFLWALSLGNLNQLIYMLVKLPMEIYQSSRFYFINYNWLILPNDTFYGRPGLSLGFVVNHLLWVIGIIYGLIKFLRASVKVIKERAREPFSTDFLTGGVFVSLGFYYLFFVPFKYTQYLVPLAAFIAYFNAEVLLSLWNRLKMTTSGVVIFSITSAIIGLTLYVTATDVNRPKMAWTSEYEFLKIEAIFRTIPKTAYVLDLVGETIYYPAPYYVTAMSPGEFAPFLSRPIPSLSETLVRTKTKYVFTGAFDRFIKLSPQDQQFIRDHYVPVKLEEIFPDNQLFVSKDW